MISFENYLYLRISYFATITKKCRGQLHRACQKFRDDIGKYAFSNKMFQTKVVRAFPGYVMLTLTFKVIWMSNLVKIGTPHLL